MSRDSKLYLQDILDAIENIRGFTAGYAQESLRQDVRTFHAVLRDLEVIGEAAKKLPDDLRHAHPEVDWKRLAGLRDVLIHQYFRISVLVVWDIVENKLPILAEQIRRILAEV